MLLSILLAMLSVYSLFQTDKGSGPGNPGGDGDGDGGDDERGNDAGDGGDGNDDGKPDPAAKLKATLTKVRGERDVAEKERKRLQKVVDDAQDKDKTDLDRATSERDRAATERDQLSKDLESLQGRLRTQIVMVALTTEATKAGARYPDLLVERLARDAEVADTDDGVTVTNAEALVVSAQKQYPDLFRAVTGKGDGGASDHDDTDATVTPGFGRLQNAYATESKTRRR